MDEVVHEKCGSNSSIMDFSSPKAFRTKLWELWSLLIDNHPLKPVMDLVKFNNSLREPYCGYMLNCFISSAMMIHNNPWIMRMFQVGRQLHQNLILLRLQTNSSRELFIVRTKKLRQRRFADCKALKKLKNSFLIFYFSS